MKKIECNECFMFHEFIRNFDKIYKEHINDLENSITLYEIFKRALDNILVTSSDILGSSHPITELFKFLVLLLTHSSNNCSSDEINQKTGDYDEKIKTLESEVQIYKDKYENIAIQLNKFEKQIELISKFDKLIYNKIGGKINDWEFKQFVCDK